MPGSALKLGLNLALRPFGYQCGVAQREGDGDSQRQDADGDTGIKRQFGGEGHRAVRDGVRRAKLNPAELKDGYVAVKLPAGDDPHFERRADGIHGLRPELRAHARGKGGRELIRREMKFGHAMNVFQFRQLNMASGAKPLRHMQGRRAGIQ